MTPGLSDAIASVLQWMTFGYAAGIGLVVFVVLARKP